MNKDNNFAFIHIMAATLVVLGHQYTLLGSVPPTLLGIDLNGLGVKILFLVSGYLVSASYLRSGSALHYVKRRLSRLYPPLFVCLIVTVVVLRLVTTTPENYWRGAVRYVLNNLEMRPKYDLNGVFTDNPYPVGVNGSLWTIPIEMACYLLLIPLMEIYKLLLSHSRKLGQTFVIAICAAVSAAEGLHHYYSYDVVSVFWNVDWVSGLLLCSFFWTGVMFQLLDLKRICNLQAAAVITAIYLCFSSDLYLLMPYVIGYLVISFALADKPLFSRLIKRDVCYGLYLYAFPVQQLMIWLIYVKNGAHASVFLMFALSLCITWILAEINYYCLERPKLHR